MMTQRTVLPLVLLAGCLALHMSPAASAEPEFDSENDLVSLHYDHAPDRDDGQSAAADRTVLQSLFGRPWMADHTLAVSGTYGKNRKRFRPESDKVMDAVFGDVGGWVAADEDWDAAVETVAKRWIEQLRAGGDVWVKEGGQSDLTADVVRRIKKEMPELDTQRRIHVVQHSDWNENQTTDADLAYTKANTHYVRIRDANAYLNRRGGDKAFVEAATSHETFGPGWRAAFAYYPPRQRLDFSDTGELFHIVGLPELDIEAFSKRFFR